MNTSVKYSFVCLFAFVAALALSCASVRSYPAPEGPFLYAEYGPSVPACSDTVKVVSFNIEHSRKIVHAIYELSELETLKEADIILLQEVDDIGAERIARMLKYNVYYVPASVFESRGRHFGNAILSKHPMQPRKKVILPHSDPHNKQKRIAISALVRIGNRPVYTVACHTSIIWPGNRKKRLDQIATVAGSIPDDQTYVITAGDFNTADRKSLLGAVDRFRQKQMKWATESIGITYPLWPLVLKLDHIFIRGFRVIDAGKYAGTKASDHYPVWTRIVFE